MAGSSDNTVEIDGAQGEGGGQVLRSALSLSMATGRPFRMVNVRASRPKPGLMRQHLTCVQAAAKVCGACVGGAELGSTTVEFAPGPVRTGSYNFAVGTAGSTTLVLQALLPALMCHAEQSVVAVEGGTHNDMAPSYDFFACTLAPLMAQTGVVVEPSLHRHGFYPGGGGWMSVQVTPSRERRPLALIKPGPVVERRLVAVGAGLPGEDAIPRKQIAMAREALGWTDESAVSAEVVHLTEFTGPGNVLMAFLSIGGVREVCTVIGQRGKRSEDVVAELVRQVQMHEAVGAPVGEHLADQLLVPMALGAGGAFLTATLSSHTRTNIETIRRFLPVQISAEPQPEGRWLITVQKDAILTDPLE